MDFLGNVIYLPWLLPQFSDTGILYYALNVCNLDPQGLCESETSGWLVSAEDTQFLHWPVDFNI